MRVLFLNVVDEHRPIHTRYYPLAFGYLVNFCETYLPDKPFKYLYAENLKRGVLKSFKPDVVAMTCITENYNLAISHANTVKNYNENVKVLIGGVHITALPNTLSRNMDFGVLGEGEQTFLELLHNDFEPSRYIKGLVYWKNGKLYKTQRRSLIEPLDLIPHPKRDIFLKENRKHYIFTSRGCPYRCIFCFSSRFWKKLRFHTPKYVAEEIRQIKHKFFIDFLHVYDDTFILDIERVREIADLVKPLNLTYSISARANLINDEIAKILKSMQVIAVGIGFESNSSKVLAYLRKGNTPEDNQRAVDILRKHKIKVFGSFIRDTPVETKQDLKETSDFIKRNKLTSTTYRLMRYPATPIYDGCRDWDSFKVFTYEPLMVKAKRFLAKIPPLKLAYHKLKTFLLC